MTTTVAIAAAALAALVFVPKFLNWRRYQPSSVVLRPDQRITVKTQSLPELLKESQR